MATGIDAKIAFETAGAGISLLNTLIQVIRENKQKGEGRDPRLSELLAQMPAEALKVANQLVEELESLRQKFLKKKFNLDRTINDLQADQSWWQYFTEGHKLVRDFEENVTSLGNAVGRFMGDFVALAKCMDDVGTITASVRNAQGRQQEVEAVIRRDVPVREILDKLLDYARTQQNELNGLV